MDDRQNQLLRALDSSATALSGRDLAQRLQVSTRSIRQYARDINRQAGEEVVQASHRGYTLDRPAHDRLRARTSSTIRRYDTPQQRLYFIARHLITHSGEGADVFDLADLLSVSPPTIEADLTRARELFREYGLAIRRDRDLLHLEGSERDQRRLARQILLNAGQGMNPAAFQNFAIDYPDYDIRALRVEIQQSLATGDLDLDEYTLNDIIIHLTIAADRVRKGHTLAGIDSPAPADQAVDAAAESLVAAVAHTFRVQLPDSERKLLTVMLSARGRRWHRADAGTIVHTEALTMVREAMRELSGNYLLDFYDESTIVDLSVHVQNLIQRARSGQALQNPLGDTFKNMHPLIHELALYFAERIEERAEVQVSSGEVDFLSFHLGTQFQRQLEQGPPVTLTVVVPRYRDTHTQAVAKLSAALGDQAVIADVVTSVDHDWERIATDLVVSALDLGELTNVPVVEISPILGRDDIDRVLDAVRLERQRVARQKVRSSILTLIEPGLFHRIPSVASKEEALAIMCHTLLAEGLTHSAFYDDVLDRERRSSTAFGGQFAIPHSMYMDARRPGISIMVTDKSIPWGSSSVRLVVLFALSPESRGIFRDVLDEFIRVLSEPANITTLIAAADTHKTFVRTLAELLG